MELKGEERIFATTSHNGGEGSRKLVEINLEMIYNITTSLTLTSVLLLEYPKLTCTPGEDTKNS